MNISVIGAGVSGVGLALLAKEQGANVFVSDKKEIPDKTKKIFQENDISYEERHSEKIFEADEILISSGIPPQSEILKEAKKRGANLTSELDYVIPKIKSENIICVTGSNGKSTVTSLIGHVLKKSGLNAGTGGNLGTASANFTRENFDAVVLELSSFQLARATKNLRSKISIITNLAPDHLDWHGSYKNYVDAKAKILSLREKNGWGIIQERDLEILKPDGNFIVLTWSHYTKQKNFILMGKDASFFTVNGETSKLFSYNETDLIGSHNLENAAMSLCAVKLLGVDISDAKELLSGFQPLPHRCELAGEIDGVKFIDDSKGTNVAASITAMKSIHGRKIIILGGQGKGEDYEPLAKAVKEECEHAILIGAEAGKIQSALESQNFMKFSRAQNMNEAVNLAKNLSSSGMVILLSPACTSWDMYPSYKARGEDFCRAVKNLGGL